MTIQIFATKEKKDGIDKNVERYSFNNINKIQLEKILKRLKGSLNDTRKKKMNPKVPFLLNLFLPFKVESFVQGDYIADDSVLVFGLLGTILLGTGIILNTNKT
ncbi:P13 family porin [Borreliella bavariensis]|uniref:P13 family porin n=1 Tax=Borreliella bavariensis TaxID=664662 RepID=UPI001F188C98|nr:P13 family porin [Borreliella bavariensis]